MRVPVDNACSVISESRSDGDLQHMSLTSGTQLGLRTETNIAADDVTFRLAKLQPLHGWFPYLEGFAPEFVFSVHQQYMPQSEFALEPFSGSGTMPIALATRGVNSGWYELNPVMQFVAKTKMSVLQMNGLQRQDTISELKDLINRLRGEVKSAEPSSRLADTFKGAFGNAEYFLPDAFIDVLKLRSINDYVGRTNSIIGDLFSLATISKLIESSLLKRAGDVRYKTEKELARGLPDVVEAVSNQLHKMASEIPELPDLIGHPEFSGSDAKKIVPPEGENRYDGLITSPPYPNGTNYFRNTRLELAYLGHLNSPKDMRRFRSDAVTAGINAVTKGRAAATAPLADSVNKVVSKLKESAYDSRIPLMIQHYFEDMAQVLSNCSSAMEHGSVACVDIGDSMYGGVHVPTHELLADVASMSGFDLTDIRLLRPRTARDGTTLGQYLLVLKTN